MFVGEKDVADEIFKQQRKPKSHSVKLRFFVFVVILGVLEDETDVLGEILRCCVMAILHLLPDSLQVHWVVNEFQVVGYIQNADGFADFDRIF